MYSIKTRGGGGGCMCFILGANSGGNASFASLHNFFFKVCEFVLKFGRAWACLAVLVHALACISPGAKKG